MGKEMQDLAFSGAVKSLSGAALGVSDDPVSKHFDEAFKSLASVDMAKVKGNAQGTLAERLAHAQRARETEFQEQFMVTAKEAAEIKALGKSGGPAAQARLEEL